MKNILLSTAIAVTLTLVTSVAFAENDLNAFDGIPSEAVQSAELDDIFGKTYYGFYQGQSVSAPTYDLLRQKWPSATGVSTNAPSATTIAKLAEQAALKLEKDVAIAAEALQAQKKLQNAVTANAQAKASAIEARAKAEAIAIAKAEATANAQAEARAKAKVELAAMEAKSVAARAANAQAEVAMSALQSRPSASGSKDNGTIVVSQKSSPVDSATIWSSSPITPLQPPKVVAPIVKPLPIPPKSYTPIPPQKVGSQLPVSELERKIGSYLGL